MDRFDVLDKLNEAWHRNPMHELYHAEGTGILATTAETADATMETSSASSLKKRSRFHVTVATIPDDNESVDGPCDLFIRVDSAKNPDFQFDCLILREFIEKSILPRYGVHSTPSNTDADADDTDDADDAEEDPSYYPKEKKTTE
jgi:hypothetical protein